MHVLMLQLENKATFKKKEKEKNKENKKMVW